MSKVQGPLALGLSDLGSPSAHQPRQQESNTRALVGGTLILCHQQGPVLFHSPPDPQVHLCQRPGEEWWVSKPVSKVAPNNFGLLCGLLCQISWAI